MIDQNPTRRDFIRISGAVAAAAALLPPEAATAAAWKDIPVGTQAWCVRKQLATEIPGTLSALSEVGYQAIELENAFGRSGDEWKQYLADAGLRACGFHHPFDTLLGDELQKSIDFNQAIGNRNLIIRSLPKDTYTSADLLKETSETVNDIARLLKPHGLRVGYHNHTDDFNRIDGEYWWNLFADQTTKDVVLQLDTGNASGMAGVDLLALLRRNAGRTASMHVKPYSKASPDAYLGDDELDWAAIMTACETVGGIEWYIIEYEREGPPPIEALKANLESFRKLRS